MARKKYTLPNPDEVEALFATVDDTGHANKERAEEQRKNRELLGVPEQIDPLQNLTPGNTNVEKLIRTTTMVFVIAIFLIVVLSQVGCSVARRYATANLSSNVSYETVYKALDNGVEWGDGFTYFPDNFTVIEANERTHRVEVAVQNVTEETEANIISSSNIQATALAVNALLNPDIDVVVYHVDIHVDGEGNPETSKLFGLVRPKGETKRFLTYVWSKHVTSDGVNFTSSITGVDADLMAKLTKDLNVTLTEKIFGVTTVDPSTLYRFKTSDLKDEAKVSGLVKESTYPTPLELKDFKILPEKKTLNVYFEDTKQDPSLLRNAEYFFILMPTLKKVNFYVGENEEPVKKYTREDALKSLEERGYKIDEIAQSQGTFTTFVNENK